MELALILKITIEGMSQLTTYGGQQIILVHPYLSTPTIFIGLGFMVRIKIIFNVRYLRCRQSPLPRHP